MITLHGFGPAFGLTDPSPFVTKTEVLLKMAGLAYVFSKTDGKGMGKAPKGKIPYITDASEKVADSTFIRWHIEKKYGTDFSGGYSSAELGSAWAFEKLCEDHLYWALVDSRWMVPGNFDKGPAHFFKEAPALIRPLIIRMVKKKVARNLHGQGFGRHERSEIERLAIADVKAISDFLGTKQYFLGDHPCGVDAIIFASIAGILCPLFDTPIRTAAEAMPNLVAYRDRLLLKYYPNGA